MARKRCPECKPNQKDTDAGKWFPGEAAEIPFFFQNKPSKRNWKNT